MSSPARILMTLAASMLVILTSSENTCTFEHDVHVSVTHVDSVSGNDIMNMSLHFRDSAKLKTRPGETTLSRYFPQTSSIQTDLSTLKITTLDGHSLPWIQIRTDNNQFNAIQFTLDGHPDDVTVDFEYGGFVRSEARMEEVCSRYFHYLVYPLVFDDCSSELHLDGEETTTFGDECSVRFTNPPVHNNITPTVTKQSRKPQIYQIALKCFGGETCTCACSGHITDFCRDRLTDTKVRSLYPPNWNERGYTVIMSSFFLCVLVKIFWLILFRKTSLAPYILLFFDGCLVFSVFNMLFFSLVIPVHVDASIRACSSVFESQGGYFLALLFWTYFPYVITLLITTGFVDNADLIVPANGSLKKAFVIYQFLSPLVQVWLFLYAYVIPFSDAMLLTTTITVLSIFRLYFRNPFRTNRS